MRTIAKHKWTKRERLTDLREESGRGRKRRGWLEGRGTGLRNVKVGGGSKAGPDKRSEYC